MRKAFYIVSLSSILLGCTGSEKEILDEHNLDAIRSAVVAPSDYTVWLATNSTQLTAQQTIGDLKYIITRLPAEVLALRDAGINADASTLAQAKENYSGLVYFKLEIIDVDLNGELLKRNLASPAEYDQRVRYASFSMQNDLSIKIGDDSLSCAMCQFERSFDVAPKATFLFAFDATEKLNDDQLVTVLYNDQLFNNGLIRFAWEPGELTAYPSLEGVKK